MRGNRLARQWRLIRANEASSQGLTATEISDLEDSGPRTIYLGLVQVFMSHYFYESLESLLKKVRSTLPLQTFTYLDQLQSIYQIGIETRMQPFKGDSPSL